MTGHLETYRRKRNFRGTPEPRGGRRTKGERLQFVVQKHDATRLHYDFRLEHDGVLKSWAVPKEPSYDPKDRRLAVEVEDHPLEYGSFEGEIPEPQYGAGTVVIWDRGHWRPLVDPERGLAEGKLDFELHGKRLRGRWTLVRMAKRGAREGRENWLLIKRSDAAPRTGTKSRTKRRARSRGKKARKAAPSPRYVPGALKADLPTAPRPQLATLVSEPPVGPEWVHEPKLDGYRLLCRVEGGDAVLLTRRGNDWTRRFPHVAAEVSSLPCRAALLDGEAVVFDERGLTDFQRLQNAIARNDPAIVLVAFDLLHLDGWDLRGAALRDRKALLRALLESAPGTLRYGEHVDEPGDEFLKEACRVGLEGTVAKRADDPYREGRTRSWQKLKCLQRQEFAIVGFTDPAGSRTGLGALLLGVRGRPGEPLRYAGKVGTGFDELALRTLKKKLEPLERPTPSVEVASARGVGRRAHWVEPELAAEISFGEWTSDGRLRHPVFHGLREDKPGREVVAERPAPPQTVRAARAVKLTNPDKVLFPDPGVTKRQLARYWETVAELALPLLRDRPLTLYRCPEGYGRQCFFQKHVGVGVPDAVARVTVDPDEEPYAMVDGPPALVALAQIGALELHVWGSRAAHLEQPDIIVFDLDPSAELEWRAVVSAAELVRARLEALGLRSFARLTGGKGLHVVVPVVPGPRWPAVKKFARALVDEIVRDEPSRFTASISKSRRGGKIFIDYLRNDRGSTAIAAYSPRARAGAPVALPIAWEELDTRAASPPRYGILDVPRLLRRRKADPWAEFESARSPLV
jgi:bifunctional non-homologous end joining protein LigD